MHGGSPQKAATAEASCRSEANMPFPCAATLPRTWARWSATPLAAERARHPSPALPPPRRLSASHAPEAQRLGCVPCHLLLRPAGCLQRWGDEQWGSARAVTGGSAEWGKPEQQGRTQGTAGRSIHCFGRHASTRYAQRRRRGEGPSRQQTALPPPALSARPPASHLLG